MSQADTRMRRILTEGEENCESFAKRRRKLIKSFIFSCSRFVVRSENKNSFNISVDFDFFSPRRAVFVFGENLNRVGLWIIPHGQRFSLCFVNNIVSVVFLFVSRLHCRELSWVQLFFIFLLFFVSAATLLLAPKCNTTEPWKRDKWISKN